MLIKKYKLIFQIFIVVAVVIALSVLTLLFQSPQSFLNNDSPKLINIPISEINKLEISNQNTKEVLIKKDRKWYVQTGPNLIPADFSQVESLLTQLSQLSKTQTSEKPTGPVTSIKINGDSLEVLIYTTNSGNYVGLRGENVTYLSEAGVKNFSDSLDYRNLWLTNSKVPMLSYKAYEGGSEVLSMKFENDQWMVVEPLKVPVGSEIGLKFSQTLNQLRGEDIAFGLTELQAGFAKPQKKIVLNNQDKEIVVLIGNYRPAVAGGPPGYYAKVDGDDRMVILSEDSMNLLPFSLEDINNLRKIKY